MIAYRGSHICFCCTLVITLMKRYLPPGRHTSCTDKEGNWRQNNPELDKLEAIACPAVAQIKHAALWQNAAAKKVSLPRRHHAGCEGARAFTHHCSHLSTHMYMHAPATMPPQEDISNYMLKQCGSSICRIEMNKNFACTKRQL